jgi:hypothetical protein
MPVKDISRFLFQPAKHYSGVRMQQGRVILDSDWNESERIDDEELRRTLLDVLCSNGTSNKGFRISAPRPKTVEIPAPVDPAEGMVEVVETYDFRIATGTFYLGGLRFEVPRDRDMGYEPFLGQPDWLQIDAEAANLPSAPGPDDLADDHGNPIERHDLVYLRGWEQPVSAVEDGELRERALGGPDTSVRIRRMRRVEVLPDVAAGCDEAFAELVERLTAPLEGDRSGWSHGFDRASSELVSKARLTLSFTGGEEQDPCKPRVTAGYLGAENQTIRVELTDTDRFLWGYDNASPLYRVQVAEDDGEFVKIHFLTRPPDEASQPRAGQAVEILPWGSILPNRRPVDHHLPRRALRLAGLAGRPPRVLERPGPGGAQTLLLPPALDRRLGRPRYAGPPLHAWQAGASGDHRPRGHLQRLRPAGGSLDRGRPPPHT